MQENKQLNRRKFLGSVGVMSALASFGPFKVFAGTPVATPAASGSMKCKPYLQAAHTESITIRWITDAPCHSWVEYGESPDNLKYKAQQVEQGMIQADNTIHAITLSGLLPEKTYYYKAVSRKTENLDRKKQTFGQPVKSFVRRNRAVNIIGE